MTSRIVKNDLFDYKDRYIFQLEDGFKFSVDSILLAEYVKCKNSDTIVDLTAGNAAIPIILSKYTTAKIYAYEVQEEIFKLAKESVIINNLDEQIEVIHDDALNIGKKFSSSSIDIIVCNPPFFKVQEDSFLNKNDYLTIARHEVKITLEDIFHIANKFLKDKGSLYLVHRVERIDDIIYLARINKINVKEMQFISTKSNEAPRLVIVKCVKNSSINIKIKKPICIEGLKTYQHIFE